MSDVANLTPETEWISQTGGEESHDRVMVRETLARLDEREVLTFEELSAALVCAARQYQNAEVRHRDARSTECALGNEKRGIGKQVIRLREALDVALKGLRVEP